MPLRIADCGCAGKRVAVTAVQLEFNLVRGNYLFLKENMKWHGSCYHHCTG